MRFALASPDIPAEALISNRANFLASSLRRFREAYLFSSQGDEVLRQISTVANYFSFPTKSWKFGFRLGNVEILSSGYGIIPVARPAILATLRIGYYTLQQIYDRLRITRAEDAETLQNKLPERFSYFDCTDYVDTDNNGVRRPLLTFALRLKRDNPQARMSWRQHLCLLESMCGTENRMSMPATSRACCRSRSSTGWQAWVTTTLLWPMAGGRSSRTRAAKSKFACCCRLACKPGALASAQKRHPPGS